jgi:universal stress protein E
MKSFSNIYFKKVLWITDGKNENKLVLQRVLAVIKNFNSRLTLVNVIGEPPSELTFFSGNNRSEIKKKTKDFQKLQMAKSHSSLEKIVATLKKNGVRADYKVVAGIESIEIIRMVLRNKYDLIIKKAGLDDGFIKRAFGTEDMHLMRDCPCPVLLIKPKVRKDHPLILAAVDPDPVNSTRDAINRMIVDYTLSIEQTFKKCEIHFIHAWDINEGTLSKVGGQAEKSAMSYRERQHRRELVDSFLDTYKWDNNRPKIHILKGNPKKLIPKLAKDLNAGLVIMGTVCKAGISGLIMGNTAETVMHNLECSILAIKPQKFVSNVTLKKIKSY